MTHLIFLAALVGCGSSPSTPTSDGATPTEPGTELPAPKPVTSPPQPDALPPATPPAGGPLVTIPGNYLPDELPLADGEEVQVICKDRLVTTRVSLIPVGEGRMMLSVPECPGFKVLLRGLSDRVGSGSITPGIGAGPFAEGRPKGFEAAYTRGVFSMGPLNDKRGYTVEMVPEEGERVRLFEQPEGTGMAGLNWVGDLDDDNVPDMVINSPDSVTRAHVRLFLSAKSATRQPEQITEFSFTLW